MTEADLRAELGAEDARDGAFLHLVSVHEAGHATAAHTLGIPIQGASVRRTGLQSGGVFATPGKSFLTAADVQALLAMLLAGRAAEEVVLGQVSSGAGGSMNSDLGRATRLAAAAAAELGLEADHGLTWTAVPDREEDLRRLLADDLNLAALVRERLAGAYATALNLIERNQGAVIALAARLRERTAMGPEEVTDILRSAECRP